MDPFVLAMAVALHAIPPKAEDYDIDAVEKAALVDLESPYMNAQVLAAMAAPYKYGVTQMPCNAKRCSTAAAVMSASRKMAGFSMASCPPARRAAQARCRRRAV